MNRRFQTIILFIMLSGSMLFAQNKYTFSQFTDETWDFIKQPLNWDGGDYLKMGIITAGTVSLMFADQPIREIVMRNQKYSTSIPMEFGRIYGDLYSPIVLFAGLATYSLVFEDDWTRKVAYEIGQASLYTGGLVFLLKMVIGRARPYMELGSATYYPFHSVLNQDYHSIPGGHSAAAFTISTIFARNVKPVWLKVLFYVPAGLTFVSRVYQNKHWTSDNFVGAALGYYIATWVVDKHEKPVKSDSAMTEQSFMDRVHFQPYLFGDFYGLNVSYTF